MPKRTYTSMSAVNSAAKRARYSARRIVRAPRSIIPSTLRGYVRTGGAYRRSNPNNRRGELKFYDVSISEPFDATMGIPNTPTSLVVALAQGTGESERIGRSIRVKSIQIKGRLISDPTTTTSYSCDAYMWLVLDTQANGANPAVTDVFTSATASSALVNLDNSQRFRILKKWHWNFGVTAGVAAAYSARSHSVDYYKKCDIPIEYSSTTGALTEIRSNNLFLICGSLGGDDSVTLSGVARVRYTDY